MSDDILIVTVGFGAFILFLVMHFVFFRSLKAEGLFKGIILVFAIAAIAAIATSLLVFHGPWLYTLGHLCLALSIYKLATFVYVLCFFGPYETSIRMRLVREIAAGKGIAPKVLSERYNTAVILDTRLKRLIGAGDVRMEQGKYWVKTKINVFFAIDAVAKRLHAFIHG